MTDATTTITGTVTAASKNGVRLDGAEEWINLPWGNPAGLVLPAKGTRVTLALDEKRKIYGVVVARAEAKDTAQPDAPQPHQEHATAPAVDWDRKDLVRTRQSCLRGACEIVAAEVAATATAGLAPFSTISAVLAMAAHFERWVERTGGDGLPATPIVTDGRDVSDWTDDDSGAAPAQSTADPVHAPVLPARPAPQPNTPERTKLLSDWARLVAKAKAAGIEALPIPNTASNDEIVGRLNDLLAAMQAVRGG